MNKCEYIGRLTSDGNLSFGATGSAFYSNTIAVDRKYKKEGEEKTTDFFRFKLFSKSAETFERYTHKGSKVFLAGHNQIDEYTTKEGQKIRDTVLYVDEFEFLDNKQNTQETSQKAQEGTGNSFLDVPDVPDGLVEELPFT